MRGIPQHEDPASWVGGWGGSQWGKENRNHGRNGKQVMSQMLRRIEVTSSLFRGREGHNQRVEGRMTKASGYFEVLTKETRKLKMDLREAGDLVISELTED